MKSPIVLSPIWLHAIQHAHLWRQGDSLDKLAALEYQMSKPVTKSERKVISWHMLNWVTDLCKANNLDLIEQLTPLFQTWLSQNPDERLWALQSQHQQTLHPGLQRWRYWSMTTLFDKKLRQDEDLSDEWSLSFANAWRTLHAIVKTNIQVGAMTHLTFWRWLTDRPKEELEFLGRAFEGDYPESMAHDLGCSKVETLAQSGLELDVWKYIEGYAHVKGLMGEPFLLYEAVDAIIFSTTIDEPYVLPELDLSALSF